MLYTYEEIRKKYGAPAKINKAIENGHIYNCGNKIFSDEEETNQLEVISKAYPNAVFTLYSAFYLYGITSINPKKIYLAVHKGEYIEMQDKTISKVFVPKDVFDMGRTTIVSNGVTLNIYDKERLLIELIRKKNKISVNEYTELLCSFKGIFENLDKEKLKEYIKQFAIKDLTYKTIKEELLEIEEPIEIEELAADEDIIEEFTDTAAINNLPVETRITECDIANINKSFIKNILFQITKFFDFILNFKRDRISEN